MAYNTNTHQTAPTWRSSVIWNFTILSGLSVQNVDTCNCIPSDKIKSFIFLYQGTVSVLGIYTCFKQNLCRAGKWEVNAVLTSWFNLLQPRNGVLGTHRKSAVFELIRSNKRFPDGYFWKCEMVGTTHTSL